MKRFQSIIQKYITNHQKHKKYLAAVLALSILVSFAVPLSLIMPAISMTDYNDNNQAEEYYGDDNIMTLSAESDYPNAVNIATADEKFELTVNVNGGNGESIYYVNKENGKVIDKTGSDLNEVTGDSLSMNFNLSYKFSNIKDRFSNGNKYMIINTVVNPHLSFDKIGNGTINAPDYGIAGSYEIKEGYILITLNDGYINKITTGTGMVEGTLQFEGDIRRDENGSGEQKFNVAGEEISVKFSSRHPEVSNKSGSLTNPADGTITWQVTIHNTYKADLSNYVLTDEMLVNATDIKYSPDGIGNHADKSHQITLNSSTSNQEWLTITYKTPIGNHAQGETIRNTATLTKNGDDKYDSHKDGSVYLDKKPIVVDKRGTPDYNNGKIKWTITVTSNYGESLEGYQVIDEAFNNVSGDVKVNGNVVNPSGTTLTLPQINGNVATIEYETTATEGTNTNNVIIKKDNDEKDRKENVDVEYKKKSDLVGLNKWGEYKPDTHEVEWTITITPESNYYLNGYELTDSQFPDALSKFTQISCGADKVQLDNANHKLIFKNDGNVSGTVTIKYKTPVTLPQGTQTTAVSNDIDDNHRTSTATAVVTNITARNSVSKSTTGNANQSVTSSGEVIKEIGWKASIISDSAFAGKTYTDTLSVEGDGATHTIDKSKANFVLKAKSTEHGSETTLTEGTDYTINIAADGKSFEIKFSDSFDSSNTYNYVDITYNTTAQLGSDYAEYKFKNGAGFNGASAGPGPGYSITRNNPNQTSTTNLELFKKWENVDAEYRNDVTVKLQYRTNKDDNHDGTFNWHDVKGSGQNYLFVGDTGYDGASEYTFTFEKNTCDPYNNNSNWSGRLENLPQKKTTKDEYGNEIYNETVEYFYRVMEQKSDGSYATVSNDYFEKDGGIYVISYDNNFNYGASGSSITVTNKFYKNIAINPFKQWIDNSDKEITDNSKIPVDSITIELQRRTEADNIWSDWETIVTSTLTKSGNWQFSDTDKEKYKNLPSAEKRDDGKLVKNEYRVVETKYNNDKAIENKNIVDGGYFEVTNNNITVTSDSSPVIQNKLFETKNQTFSLKKVWEDEVYGVDYSEHRPSSITFELQRQANNSGSWETLESYEMSSPYDNLTHEFSTSCPTQKIDTDADGKVTITEYKYRVVETGYTFNGKKIKLSSGTRDFITSGDGYWKIETTSANSSGEVDISNRFVPYEKTSVKPQKKWTDDSEFTSNRKNVKLRLQWRVDNNSEWEDYKDSDNKFIEVELTSSNAEQSDDSTWTGNEIENLPESGLAKSEVTENGATKVKYETKYYEYRFVELGDDGQPLADGASFQAKDGSYKVTYGSSTYDTDSMKGNTLCVITNTFKKSVGIEKGILDKNGSLITSIDKSDLENWAKITIDNEEYYVFNWLIKFEAGSVDTINEKNKDILSPVIDILPDGFTLCEDSTKTEHTKVEPNVNGSTVSDAIKQLHSALGDYYPAPIFTWTSNYALFMGKKGTEAELWKTALENNYYYYEENYQGNTVKADIPNQYNPNLIEQLSYKYNDNDNEHLKGHNVVIFNRPVTFVGAKFPFISYSTKVKVTDLQEKLRKGTYTITNHAERYTIDNDTITRTHAEDSASLTIVNNIPTGLIAKNGTELEINKHTGEWIKSSPGEYNFSIDVNPEGKNLSNGDTIDIEDLFETTGYFDQHDNFWTNGNKLVDILMKSIVVSEVDANGNKTALNKSEYVLEFDNTSVENGAALMKLTVPDERHLVIDYTYKMIANANTPSVIKGCRSDVLKKGKYLPMEPGFIPPSGDKIRFKNTASLKADSASDTAKFEEDEYQFFKSSGTINTTRLPKIIKVNTGNTSINDLKAQFLIAQYNQSTGKWSYATKIDEVENKANKEAKITEWSDEYSGSYVPDNAAIINVQTEYQIEVNLSQNSLYKLIEVKVPNGYEGSNLGLSDDEFKQLIVNYLNNKTTSLSNGKDYDAFLKNYVHTHYFVYNSVLSSYPDGIEAKDVIQVKQGEDVEIPNNQLINIGVGKEWNDHENPDDSITVQLYWSYTKDTSKIPDDVKVADASDLGMNEFDAEKTLKMSEFNNAKIRANVWTDLPNGKDGKPIYYYIKETAYTIGGITYTLDESDGAYKHDENKGAYYPIYIGNAANVASSNGNPSAVVQIKNTQSLVLKKAWKDSNNNPLTKGVPNSINVSIYGTDKDTNEEILLFENIELSGDIWEANITERLTKEDETIIDLSQYKSFRAEETGINPEDYTISCVFNLNSNSGEITVTNKSKRATSKSVTVDKVWSDGADVHKDDSIEVSIYRSTQEITDLTNLTDEKLTAAGAVKMTDTADIKYTVDLNSTNGWSYTWTGLPMDDEENGVNEYFYYVLETMNNVKAGTDKDLADKYTASYIATTNGAKTTFTVNNTRRAIKVQKEWYDADNELIPNEFIDESDGTITPNEALNGLEIKLSICEKAENPLIRDGCHPSEDGYEAIANEYLNAIQSIYGTPPNEELEIIALGDSITDGYDNFSKGEKCYPSKLTSFLTKKSYKIKGNSIVNKGISGQRLGANATDNDTIRKRVTSDITDTADIVLLLGGTNDIHQGRYDNNAWSNPTECMRRLEACMKEIQEQAKNAIIIVGSIPHFDYVDADGNSTSASSWWGVSEADANKYIDQYNALIKAYAESSNNNNVYYVDTCTAVDGIAPAKDENGNTLSEITLNSGNNWTAIVDVTGDDKYYVTETKVTLNGEDVTDEWIASYEDNGQKAESQTPVIVKNKKAPVPTTSISIEKKWVGDDAIADASERAKIKLELWRTATLNATDENGNSVDTWEYYADVDSQHTGVGDTWTYTCDNLPAKDNFGNNYYYKVVESDMDGYTVSYLDAEKNGKTSGTLHVTNTRTISLKFKKIWSDSETVDHTGDTVKINVYRSTNLNDVPNGEQLPQMLKVPENVSVGVGKTESVTANKDISIISVEPSDVITADVNGNTINITGNKQGKATITVKDKSGETATITVTVSALEMFLNDGTDFKIEAGTTGTLSAKLNGSVANNVTFSSDSNVISISGSTITANGIGEADITAKVGDVSITQTITVTLPSHFSITGDNEVTMGNEINLGIDKNYGTFTWSSSEPNVATVDQNGKVTGISAGDVTITATRNDGEVATKKITVKNGDIAQGGVVVTLRVGDTITLTSSLGVNGVDYHDGSIVETSKNGDNIIVTAKSVGKITIGFQDVRGGYQKHYFDVIVIDRFTVSPANTTLAYGQSVELNPNQNVAKYEITSGSDLISISGNIVTANAGKEGTATIKATNNSGEIATITINVVEELQFVEQKFDATGDITYDKSQNISSIVLHLDSSNASSWPYTTIKFDDNNYVKVGYPGSADNFGLDSNNGYKLENINVEIDKSAGNATITFKDGYQPPNVKIDFVQNSAKGIVYIYYGSASAQTYSMRSAMRMANSPVAQAEAGSEAPFYYDTVELGASTGANWTATLDNLDVYAPDGSKYYYWAVEEDVSGYTASYYFDDASGDTEYCIDSTQLGSGEITIKNTKNESSSVEMPSTGGKGVKWYYMTGMVFMFVSAAGIIIRRRKNSVK